VSPEYPRTGELAQLVADHVLRNEDRDVPAAIMDGDIEADHFRQDGAGARPSLDNSALAASLCRPDALQQLGFYERSLLR